VFAKKQKFDEMLTQGTQQIELLGLSGTAMILRGVRSVLIKHLGSLNI